MAQLAITPNYSSGTRTGSAGSVSFGAGAYGSRPAATPIPKSTWEEAAAANPGLYALNDSSNTLIKNQMAGVLSPETLNSYKDNAATFGVSSGMPGSQLSNYGGLRNLGLNVEQYQNQGLQNYLSALKTTGSMQLDPGLVSSTNAYNNALAAAPDPATAAAQEEALWQKHFAQTNGPAGGTGGYGSGPVGPRINPGPAASTTTGTANTDPFGLARSETIFGSLADAGGVTANQTPLWGPQGYNFDPNYYNMLANPAGAGESLYPWAGQNVLKGQDAPFNYDTASMA